MRELVCVDLPLQNGTLALERGLVGFRVHLSLELLHRGQKLRVGRDVVRLHPRREVDVVVLNVVAPGEVVRWDVVRPVLVNDFHFC